MNKIQRENLAKFCYDVAKVAVGGFSLADIFKPELMTTARAVALVSVIVLSLAVAYWLDGNERR